MFSCAMDMVSTVLDDTAARKLRAFPLSSITVGRCIYHMSKDIKEQRSEKMCSVAFLCRWMKPLTGTKTVF